MTTEQKIKALEKEYDRHHKLEKDLKIELNIAKALKNTLALIKELQAQNENLKKENKYLRESLADEREHKEDMRAEGKWIVEAYKGDEIVNIPYIEHQHNEPFCSRCRKYALLDGGEEYVASNYCPHCGAKMKGE